MCDNIFTKNSTGEGMGVNVFEIGLNVSPKFKQQVCYGAQTAQLPKQTSGGLSTSLNLGTLG